MFFDSPLKRGDTGVCKISRDTLPACVGWVKRSGPITSVFGYEASFVIRPASNDTEVIAVFHFIDGCAPASPILHDYHIMTA